MNLNSAAINQRSGLVHHLVLFQSSFRLGLLTRIMALWVIFATIIGLVAGEMSLSDFPCYKPKPSNYRMGLRIVGGADASAGGAPYMAALMKHGGVFCGASIISENFLVLAAHCVCNSQNDVVQPSQLKAVVGMNKLSDLKARNNNDAQGITEIFVSKIIVHPDYVCGKKAENDIGKMKFLHL